MPLPVIHHYIHPPASAAPVTRKLPTMCLVCRDARQKKRHSSGGCWLSSPPSQVLYATCLCGLVALGIGKSLSFPSSSRHRASKPGKWALLGVCTVWKDRGFPKISGSTGFPMPAGSLIRCGAPSKEPHLEVPKGSPFRYQPKSHRRRTHWNSQANSRRCKRCAV